MGITDHYVAAVKAALYNLSPQSTVMDISHGVRPFDIHHAAYLLRSVWQMYPLGTVHMIGVRPELTKEQSHVVVQHMGHFFVGADCGVFGLLFETPAEDVFEVNLPLGEDWNFPMKGALATCAAHLANGGVPELLGRRIAEYRSAMPVTPIVEDDKILAHVIHIDHYGNAFTDLSRQQFEAVRRGRDFALIPRRSSFSIRKISSIFHEIPEGDAGAIWSSNDFLMVAIGYGAAGHGGGAAQLFGLQINDLIRIEFHGEAHR